MRDEASGLMNNLTGTSRAELMNSKLYEDLQEKGNKLKIVSQNFSGSWFQVANARENIRKQERERKENTP
jgi:predicted nucleotide-binding protein (sugar kinase/HSP70/actin superfamily)